MPIKQHNKDKYYKMERSLNKKLYQLNGLHEEEYH